MSDAEATSTQSVTEDQQGDLAENRKGTDKPKFYSANNQVEEPIGDDLEGFLILANKSLIAEIAVRVDDDAETDTDRDELFQECLDAEGKDAVEVISVLQVAVDDKASAKARVLEAPFGNTPDMAPILEDMERSHSRALEMYELLFNRIAMVNMMTVNRENTNNSHVQKQQSGWGSVFGKYL